ncbi:MAG: protein translocase subunit SecF [Porticoccus sp.]|jgi:preprotein translocase subunit SecF|nr:protein translocase subunit SecF [Porticoccus sp.]
MITDSVVNFMGQRKVAFILSIFLIIGSIVSFGTKGLVLGLDFTGGTQIEVGYQESANLIDIRAQLTKAGFEAPVVVHFGSERDVLIRMQGKPESGLSDAVLQALQTNQPNVVLRRVDFVGPQVGEELREDGGLGMLVALLVVMMYIAIRFQYKFSLGAVVALAHDVIITLGFFSVTGLEFDLTVLAAVLAVIGYSLNDTIVVSDRIRENLRLLRISNIETVINKSLTQTLGRTLVTSLTTLLVLVSLFLFGGELIHNFAIALIVGVFIGTYSSIYVASNMLLTLGLQREDLMSSEKEDAEINELP